MKRKAERESRSQTEPYDDRSVSQSGNVGEDHDGADDHVEATHSMNDESVVPSPQEKRSNIDFVPAPEQLDDLLPKKDHHRRMEIRGVRPEY